MTSLHLLGRDRISIFDLVAGLFCFDRARRDQYPSRKSKIFIVEVCKQTSPLWKSVNAVTRGVRLRRFTFGVKPVPEPRHVTFCEIGFPW